MNHTEEPEYSRASATTERVPTRASAALFRVKATCLQARRAALDTAQGIERHGRGRAEEFPLVIAESRSALWSDANTAEYALQRGKVQNLRCAVRQLNSIEIPAGKVFSFWKQVGRATQRRGFVPGRLLREGCLMPAVGGGLCQISNALYDVALQSESDIIERWGHSRIVPGAAAATGRDATVAWNYIDLRFRPAHAILLEAFLTSSELVVRVRARTPRTPRSTPTIIPMSLLTSPPALDATAHSCVTCGQHTCFRNAPQLAPGSEGSTAWLIDECWPEFREYARRHHQPDDVLGIPLDNRKWWCAGADTSRYDWPTGDYSRVRDAGRAVLWRAWQTRRMGRYGAARLQAQIDDTHRLALQLSKVLNADTTHVVVAQSLLPFLWREGHLGGRTFDVLMTRLPLSVLHERLDNALKVHPDRLTLAEFRAPQWLVESEAEALSAAARVITPHTAVARLFPQQAQALKWQLPDITPPATSEQAWAVAFPGPTAARKGAYELREAAQQLNLTIALCGTELEGDNFWCDVATRRARANWLGVKAVVQPALIEDQPRRLLTAIAAGVPVIASPACGLEGYPGVLTVPYGDVDALTAALAATVECGMLNTVQEELPVS